MDWTLDLFSFFSRNTTWDILSPGTVCLEKTVLGEEVGGLGGASVVKASSEIHRLLMGARAAIAVSLHTGEVSPRHAGAPEGPSLMKPVLACTSQMQLP